MVTHDNQILFSESELRCKGTGLLILAPGFSEKLLELRLQFDEPMLVNSCCRADIHNTHVGGHPRSLHVCDFPYWPTNGTAAIDIRSRGKNYDKRLRELAWSLGWSIGINEAFTHLDRRTDFIPKQYPQHKQRTFDY